MTRVHGSQAHSHQQAELAAASWMVAAESTLSCASITAISLSGAKIRSNARPPATRHRSAWCLASCTASLGRHLQSLLHSLYCGVSGAGMHMTAIDIKQPAHTERPKYHGNRQYWVDAASISKLLTIISTYIPR